ncbi:TetR family transcriptional regulator [Dactylosporangium sp. AC04546]|uniref:acyl-CoA-like ligand-binding transcription factor n=1 Tax=Dactylosporangium sp. AC04546 TaxID=2862460 RepID=UPI001EE0B457|nr:TetR family transcriptional regulator [Dactylosporangium sp. AC04546]WVK83460.1 TetR family transcriptional regulator [Dactylosporangium sp. AC04546]
MSSPGLRERKKQKTRWAIQEHAVRLFAQQGYDATTVEQIAEAAEISPSTFFRYFKTKEDVVIQDRYDDMMIEAIRAAPQGLTPLEVLRTAIVDSFAQINAEEMRQALERAKLSMSVPALRMRSLDNMQSSIRLLAAPLAERLGRAPDDFRSVAFVGACVGAMINALIAWVESDGDGDPLQLVEEALSVVAEGP